MGNYGSSWSNDWFLCFKQSGPCLESSFSAVPPSPLRSPSESWSRFWRDLGPCLPSSQSGSPQAVLDRDDSIQVPSPFSSFFQSWRILLSWNCTFAWPRWGSACKVSWYSLCRLFSSLRIPSPWASCCEGAWRCWGSWGLRVPVGVLLIFWFSFEFVLIAILPPCRVQKLLHRGTHIA